jgi:23S rRNA (cytidine2498-2'-O)-methyltransferase
VRGDFLLVTCHGGAEAVLTARVTEILPRAVRAAWRRGVVSFRLGGEDPPADLLSRLSFAQAVIRSLGQVAGSDDADRLAKLGRLVGDTPFAAVHVWARDPRSDVDVAAIRGRLLAARGLPGGLPAAAAPGDLVLDCLVDTPDRWWVGWHRADSPSSRYAGGRHPRPLPAGKVSRAWLKLDEAFAVFTLDPRPGERALELGAAPGGACQRLLEAGLSVVGVDPAVVDPVVAAHPAFEQWRMRARDVRLKACRGFDWLVADMNIDPRSTLAALERIATAEGVRARGIVATLKLPDWSRAKELPEWLDRFRGWGFEPEARQLSSSGREVCVVARRTLRAEGRGPRVTRRATRRRGR